MATIFESQNESLKCTLCPYAVSSKGKFQHHLMSLHGFKLKDFENDSAGNNIALGRILDEYILNYCLKCEKFIPDMGSSLHGQSCNGKNIKLHKRNHCKKCNVQFSKRSSYRQHLDKCEKGQLKYHCRLCTYRSSTMECLSQHTIDRHNLIPRPVDEADFEQALRGTPYTLERAVVLDTLPDVSDMAGLRNASLFGTTLSEPTTLKKELKILPAKRIIVYCPRCKKKCLTARYLKKHKCQI